MALVLRIYDLAVERAAIELRSKSLISLETVLKRLQHLEISDWSHSAECYSGSESQRAWHLGRLRTFSRSFLV